MKSFKEFYGSAFIIGEELHKELQSILDDSESDDDRHSRIERNPYNTIATDPVATKLKRFTKKARELLTRGEESGLDNATPKKGSSRAVFFPRQNRDITLDGRPAKVKSAVKIAFPGALDRFKRNDERLLGEHQNQVEADPLIRNHYGMLSEIDKGRYHTNPNGILAPVYSNHPDDHYLEMGHVTPMKKSDFQRLTVSESHPKGLRFDDMKNAMMKEHEDAHGMYNRQPPSHTDEVHERTMQHPFVHNLYHMMTDSGFHPSDISVRNMGIWTHPHTGKQHPVISDYGFSNHVAKEYMTRRMRQFKR